MHKDGIAIVGLGCRFPGGINDPESFWKLLSEGREAVGEVPPDRWNVERFYDAEPGIPGKSVARRGGFLENIDRFDAAFFGISPREAAYVDPQQRLLLETAWEAIESAGIVLDLENGTDMAVFVGISHNDYQIIQGTPWDSSGISQHSPTGSAHSIAANRISYCLNLRGASVAMDTACSSALTAVHAACEHIWSRRCGAALAGGVTVMITPGGFIGFSQAGMLSPDGRCAAFDASANGFVRGEGAGMVLLKPLARALADGDPVLGIIRGTAMNQDGSTNGISLPSAEAQARLVVEACADAKVAPGDIDFVEAHGTGTAVGDPIEAHALAEALCRDRETPLPIGSVKTNIGHLETAAGLAGLVKACLVLRNRQIPPTLHFRSPSPHIDFDALRLRVPVALESLPDRGRPRYAGVNSFGFGGANTHVIVEEPPSESHPFHGDPGLERFWPVMLSARTEPALRESARRLASWLEARADANGESPVLPDLTYTLGARRNHHSFRATLGAGSVEEVIRELRAWADGVDTARVRTAFSPRRAEAPRVGFVLSGQGPQWWGMGRELFRCEPVFRRTFESCAAALRPFMRCDLLEELARDEATSELGRTEIGQPAIFAMNIALAALWKAWGVEPAAVVGHSVSEVAAAHLAGILSLEDASRILGLRSRFMEECGKGEGTMLAVGLPEEEARILIVRHDRSVSISAFNSPRSVTLSGPRMALESIAAELEAAGTFARFVKVDHPFHHPLMEPAAVRLEEALGGIEPTVGAIPLFSTVTGGRCAGGECGPGHWADGVRGAVRFAPAVAAMAGDGIDVWLELSAHPALAVSLRECLPGATVVASIRREAEQASLVESVLELHRAGVRLDYAAITPSRRLLPLPAYAWDRERWWSEAADWREGRLGAGGRGLIDCRLTRAVPTWLSRLDARHMAYLRDHAVGGRVIFPAAGFVELILEAGVDFFEGRPFVIEDLEIQKPLMVPEDTSGLQIEITLDPRERRFSIQSRFEHSASWSLHVVGAIRSERTESDRPEFSAVNGLSNVDVREFYGGMARNGLIYGEEFRSVRELAAGGGGGSGFVALSDRAAKRAGEYAVHPVLFDGALHIFSAGAATVERTGHRLKLPVRFSRIAFLRPMGAGARVESRVADFNDDFVEGDLTMFDADGRAGLEIRGFRAVSVAGFRGKSSQDVGDLIYHVGWEKVGEYPPEALTMPPMGELVERAEVALADVLKVRGKERLEDALASADRLAGAQIAAALRDVASDGNLSGLPVAPSMQRAFGRLMLGLAEQGLVERTGEEWRATPRFLDAAESAPSLLAEFIASHPGHLPEAQLCTAVTSELVPILGGERDAVQALFAGPGAEWLEQFYGDGLLASHWLAAISEVVRGCERALPEGRGLRILEIGAGTGGLAGHLLPLLERNRHRYVFSDNSAAFFGAAGQKLADFPEVEFRVLDLERPVEEADLGAFDLVVGSNVLHAVADIRSAVQNLHDLLVPGGTLAFMDTASPQLWTETVFGLTSGWWRFIDGDLRPETPLIPRPAWERVLSECGFESATSLGATLNPRGGEGQIAIFARKNNECAKPALIRGDAVGGRWMILADAGGLGDELSGILTSRGAQVVQVRRGAEFRRLDGAAYEIVPHLRTDWDRILAEDNVATCDRVVDLWALDGVESEAFGTDTVLHLTQAWASAQPGRPLRLDLISRDAQGVAGGGTGSAQAPLIGLLRVIRNEYPNWLCRSIDLPSGGCSAGVVLGELVREETRHEIALRSGGRFSQVIRRGPEARLSEWAGPLCLRSKERGQLDALEYGVFDLPECGAREVLIDTVAAGLNFRDVLKALGVYPGEAPDARIFGDEVSGIVRAVGRDVRHLAVGDPVFGLAGFGLATQTIARASDMRRVPSGLSFEEAATMPVVFLTALYAIEEVARLRRGESILIQAGAGGVGMAALQVARVLGLEVIASAGSPAKRALLRTLGVRHVIDSRSGDFAEAVRRITGGRGVDAVLNSLAGEAIPMGLACLAESGRFLEIGKRDIHQNSRIPLWPLRRNASFHVIAMDAIFQAGEESASALMDRLVELIEAGAVRPLPFRAFPAMRTEAAFRHMAQGKHSGKVVVSFAKPLVHRRTQRPAGEFRVRPDASYLVTGAFGGFGRVIANWLAGKGAQHLVLMSRSGAASEEARTSVDALVAKGIRVDVVSGDVGDEVDMDRAIAAAGPSLVGVFHLAMTIDDAPLETLDRERMVHVLRPKCRGAMLLHEATRDRPLDAFVLFSSVSSVFGNPAQGNYAAANSYLDALAHHRRAIGLPGLAVNWGVLGGRGYVARNEKVAEYLARQGTGAVSESEVIELLERFLSNDTSQALAIRVDWSKWRQAFRGLASNPMIQSLIEAEAPAGEGQVVGDWRERIQSAPAEERPALIAAAVREIVASVLRLKPDALRDDQPLTDLGLDSLMGVEIETSMERVMGVALPPTSLMRARTIGQIAELIDSHLGGETQRKRTEPSVPEPAVDVESISDEEIEALMQEGTPEVR
ncbi:MAG: SDR family NAD(P)-dependent oxidoreductase [Terrimicrobiaceae bacterium]|nr:SDR family NAD(P)-dependent oxidoreductase [Terrimicrobiaceae bacterium]